MSVEPPHGTAEEEHRAFVATSTRRWRKGGRNVKVTRKQQGKEVYEARCRIHRLTVAS